MAATATIAERARESAISCEAKKHAYRQTQDGVVVSFVLHPQEVPEGLATAPLGTRYMLALVEIGDDETPIGGEARGDHAGDMAVRTHESVTRASGPPIKKHRPFDTLPIATQAAIWGQEPAFWKLLERDFPDEWARKAVEGLRYDFVAACVVRDICNVNSRGSIKADNAGWRDIVARYQVFTRHPELG